MDETEDMFLDWKNQYCQNDYTVQGNLQIQCNPYPFTKDIFHGTQTKYFKVCLEAQKTQISQTSLKRKIKLEESNSLTSDRLQSNSHQNHMVLAQRQTYRSVEQDRKPRIKPTHLQPTHLWQRRSRIYNGEKTACSLSVAGKSGQPHGKEWN